MIWRVSSSGRTCGRPRQRLSSEAALAVSWAASREAGSAISGSGVILAMLLHDACHSIDSPNVGAILENIKFPNSGPKFPARPGPPPSSQRGHQEEALMTHHSTAFEIERPVPADEAITELLP